LLYTQAIYKGGKVRLVVMACAVFLLFAAFLHAADDEEIAGIKEIVEVKKSIVIPKDPVISALLAVQYPGLGQVYCGKYWRAAGIFFGEISLIAGGIIMRGEQKEKFTYAVIDSAQGDTVWLEGQRTVDSETTETKKMIGNAMLLTAVGIHVWQIFDAYHQANAHNRDMIERSRRKDTGLRMDVDGDRFGIAFYKTF
jgi:hypothetical protein